MAARSVSIVRKRHTAYAPKILLVLRNGAESRSCCRISCPVTYIILFLTSIFSHILDPIFSAHKAKTLWYGQDLWPDRHGQKAILTCRMTYEWQAKDRQYNYPPPRLSVSVSWISVCVWNSASVVIYRRGCSLKFLFARTFLLSLPLPSLFSFPSSPIPFPFLLPFSLSPPFPFPITSQLYPTLPTPLSPPKLPLSQGRFQRPAT